MKPGKLLHHAQHRELIVTLVVALHSAHQQRSLLTTSCAQDVVSSKALPPHKIAPLRTSCNIKNVHITSFVPPVPPTAATK